MKVYDGSGLDDEGFAQADLVEALSNGFVVAAIIDIGDEEHETYERHLKGEE